MANEARINCGLNLTIGNLQYQSVPSAFVANVSTAKGPTPGCILVAIGAGTDISLAVLTQPGLVWIQNLDQTNYVEWGVHDGVIFHPVGELLPGEGSVFRFSRNIQEEDDLPGTGTTGNVNTFFMRANTAACNVRIDAFET